MGKKSRRPNRSKQKKIAPTSTNNNWTGRTVYEGEYKNGKMSGNGKCTFASGDVYEGDWKDGKMNGKGKCTHTNGDVL